MQYYEVHILTQLVYVISEAGNLSASGEEKAADSFDVSISEDHKNKLIRCRNSIVQDLLYKFISDRLIECDVLDDKFWEELEASEKTPTLQNEKLLDYLDRRTERAYYTFVWALKTDYHWLYEKCKSLCPFITIWFSNLRRLSLSVVAIT